MTSADTLSSRLDRSTRCAVAVMAKAPQPGRCKTRLVPPLTHEGAACISAAFLRDVTDNIGKAAEAAAIDAWVAYAPAGDAGRFDGIVAGGTGRVLADGAVDLPPPMQHRVQGFGRCLLHAMQSLFSLGYGAVCVLNADSPTLPTSLLCDTARHLLAPGDRAVLGPADDGGYYLLGLKAPNPLLFADIDWSTDRVAAQTRARAAEAALPLIELATWYDVDERAALARLLTDLRRAGEAALRPYPAAATAACARALGLTELVAAG